MADKHQKNSVTFRNNTPDIISFSHQYKNISADTFRLDTGESHEEKLTEGQTNEKYWLLDSSGTNTEICVDVDDLRDCKEVTATKTGDTYTLTIVPRSSSLLGQAKAGVQKLSKFFKGKDETLPTRQNNPGSSSA